MIPISPSKNHPIYMDYLATTPADPRVVARINYYITTAFGNTSSVDHAFGDEAFKTIGKARIQTAKPVNASSKEVIFTSPPLP